MPLLGLLSMQRHFERFRCHDEASRLPLTDGMHLPCGLVFPAVYPANGVQGIPFLQALPQLFPVKQDRLPGVVRQIRCTSPIQISCL